MTLQDKLDDFTKDFVASGKMPKPAYDGIQEGIREQVDGGHADRGLKAGERAPVFKLTDADGATIDSAAMLAKGPLVVSFYRGVWCPYCNIELKALEEARGEIAARGASIVAVSMQTAVNSRKSARENGLSFPILSDLGGEVAEAFGLRYTLPQKTIGIYKTIGLDLASINGEDSWRLPMPARYVIGQDGVIAYAEVNADPAKRPDPGELYPVLEQLARVRAV